MLFSILEGGRILDKKDKKRHTAVILWKYGPDGGILVLVQNTRSLDPRFENQPSRTGFPGGGEKPEDRCDPVATGIREVEEETSLHFIGGPVTVFPEIEEKETIKTFLLIKKSSFTGVVRQKPIMDGTDLIQPPVFLPLTELGRTLYETHQPGLIAALRHFGLMG